MTTFTQPRRRLWNSRLWILAAALGAVTLVSMVATVHDTRQVRQAAHVVVLAKAEQVAEHARHRLDVLALEMFAPAMTAVSANPRARRAAVDAIAREQREAERCQCRATVPALQYFRFDAAAGTLDVAATASGAAGASVALLTELARREATRTLSPGHPATGLLVGPRLGDYAIISLVQKNGNGESVAVYGVVSMARHAARVLFGPELAPRSGRDSTFELATLDSLSLEVATADSTLLFGQADPGRPLRATVRPRGALEGLRIDVALNANQIAYPLMFPIPPDQLWHIAALLAATILAIGVAVGSSRREALLARARSDFIAGVSHDLRMPLAQILLASETLAMQRERNAVERVTFATSIVREARRLIALVDNVLLFSRSGAVDLRPRLQPVSVDALFVEVIDAVQLAVDDARQTIGAGAAPSVAVLGDRQLLRQALVNLVDNAIKYGSAGQRIRIGSGQHTPTSVRLYVNDDGPGVPESERDRVFEPYERLARDQTSERTGSGLGLAVVRHIARACQGKVWLEERQGRGTRVVLEFRSADLPEPAVARAGVS